MPDAPTNDANTNAERYLAIWNETDAALSSPRAGRIPQLISIR